jgi:hypothetical protein
MCWILYQHCKGYNQKVNYRKAKVVLKGSSVEQYNSDLHRTPKGSDEVVAQGWVRYLVLHKQSGVIWLKD